MFSAAVFGQSHSDNPDQGNVTSIPNWWSENSEAHEEFSLWHEKMRAETKRLVFDTQAMPRPLWPITESDPMILVKQRVGGKNIDGKTSSRIWLFLEKTF